MMYSLLIQRSLSRSNLAWTSFIDGDLELADGPVQGHDLLLVLRHPAEEDEVVGQGLGQEAFVPVFADGDPAVPLRELGPVPAQDEGHVAELGDGEAQGLVEQDLLGRVRDVVVAPEDMGDPEVGVVDDAGEIVGRRAVGLDEDLVLVGFGLERDEAVDHVPELDRPARLDPEEDRLPVPVRLAGGDEGLGLFPVDVEPPALEDGLFVPVEAQPAEVVEDLVQETRRRIS